MYNFRNPFYASSTFSNKKYYSNYHNPPKFQSNFSNNSYHNNPNNYANIYNNNYKTNSYHEKASESISAPKLNDNNKNEQNSRNIFDETNNKELFEIFGLKIYFDDVLIICILLFLYQEGVKDEYLFVSLILLLLN